MFFLLIKSCSRELDKGLQKTNLVSNEVLR